MSSRASRDGAVPFQGTVVLLHRKRSGAGLEGRVEAAFAKQTALRLEPVAVDGRTSGSHRLAELAVEVAELNPCVILAGDDAAREAAAGWHAYYPGPEPSVVGLLSPGHGGEGTVALEDGSRRSAFLDGASWREGPGSGRYGAREGRPVEAAASALGTLMRLAPAEVELYLGYANRSAAGTPYGHLALRVGEAVWTWDRRALEAGEAGPLLTVKPVEHLYGTRSWLRHFQFGDAVGACYRRSVLGLRLFDVGRTARAAMQAERDRLTEEVREGRLTPGRWAGGPAALLGRVLEVGGLLERPWLPPMPLDLFMALLHAAEERQLPLSLVHYRRIPAGPAAQQPEAMPWRALVPWPGEALRRHLETRAQVRVEAEGRRLRLDTRAYQWHAELSSSRRVLLTPGPVALSPRVREAPTPDLSDREPAFSALFEDVTRKLLALAELPADRYQALLLGVPGAGAVESCVEAMAGLGRLVVLSNGASGERMAALAASYRPDATSVIEFNRRATLDGRTIRKSLRPDRVKAQSVLVVHHEVSTGMLNSLDEVAGLCREHGAFLFVDATASLGAHSLDLQRLGVALCAGGAELALGGSPGVSFVLGERQFLKRLPPPRETGRTLDLAMHLKLAVERAELPYAAPIEAMVRLAAALGELLEHGVAGVHEELARRAAHVRRGLMGAGLHFPVELSQMSSVSTPVLMPAGLKASVLYEALLTRGFVTGRCPAPDEETMLQVGHAGALSAGAIDRFLGALEEELRILARR